MMSLASIRATAHTVHPPPAPALLDVLLPVTRVLCDDHHVALEKEKHNVEIAELRVGCLKRRLQLLDENP